MTYLKYSSQSNDESFHGNQRKVLITKKQVVVAIKKELWQKKRPPRMIRKFVRRQKRGTWHERFTSNVLKELGEVHDRQVPIQCGSKWYIMDFYLPMRKLCLEIDGPSHKKQRDYDKQRDLAISTHGIRTHRIENAVMHNVMQAYYLLDQAFKGTR